MHSWNRGILKSDMIRTTEISHRTIFFIIGVLAAIWLLFIIRDIIFLLFLAFILMSALRPLVERLVRLKIPRPISILLIYAIIFGFLGFGVAGLVPSISSQSTRLIERLPAFISQQFSSIDIDSRSLTSQIQPIGENLFKFTIEIFSNIFGLIAILVVTFYFLLERKRTEIFLVDMIGKNASVKILQIVRQIEQKLGTWVNGQLFIMFLIGLVTYIGLLLLKIEFALPLAILAGLLEIVPLIGPVLAGIPAVVVALSVSPVMAVSVIALYVLIQQVENTFVVPLIMKKSTGLSPLIIIISLMIGGRLAGLIGILLAVPVVLVLQIVAVSVLGGREDK